MGRPDLTWDIDIDIDRAREYLCEVTNDELGLIAAEVATLVTDPRADPMKARDLSILVGAEVQKRQLG